MSDLMHGLTSKSEHSAWQAVQYKCPTCDKSYTESHNLKKHRQKEHGL